MVFYAHVVNLSMKRCIESAPHNLDKNPLFVTGSLLAHLISSFSVVDEVSYR